MSISNGGNRDSNKRASPLAHFSVDIVGPTCPEPISPGLPHQSCSLPVVPRLMRTHSTSSSSSSNPVEQDTLKIRGECPVVMESQRGEHSGRLANSWSPSSHLRRSPSPIRRRLATSPTPLVVSGNNALGLTPYPSPRVSPAPSVTSIFSSSDRSATNSPLPSPSLARLERSHCRSPMLSLTKMNSMQSSSWSSNSTLSQGSTTSLSTVTTTLSNTSAHTPLGMLQPELYKRETTIVLAASNNETCHSSEKIGEATSTTWDHDKHKTSKHSRNGCVTIGRLHFRLSYDFDKSDLIIHLIEARDLKFTGDTNSSSSGSVPGSGKDAHVRICLVPEVDQRRRQSALRRQEGNYFFDEHFKFPVSYDDLHEKMLLFQVCDYDRFSRPCVIGDLQLSLAEHDITSSVEIWGDIMRNTTPDEERPQLLISLSYLPSAERLTVVVLKAKNLVIPANKETIDPLVKLYLLVNGKRVKKKKTEVRKATGNPVWNQALTFTVPSPKLHSCTLEISVVDNSCDRGGKTAQLGTVALGPEQSHTERQHWQDMAHNVRKSIAMWHVLH